ncbi:7TM diverse intracellular signaling domain-containing protein [Cyclobacterium sp. SYSU L10401]|uniref:7TM diverse intracellular signaling domain-containing protein n=1 Tax=Cyclobacterium sp. SYSU L10401 TaxID=2678657 RepID=UPI0013D46DA8|nr:7TM diverse intracellular signaling domain-containing protein [Cyclobacterium sp. SYSU L10401]
MHIRIRLRMAVLLKLFHLLVFLLVAALGFGQRISGEATLRIDDNWNERIYAIDQLEFFEDSSNSLMFEDIIKAPFQQNFKINANFSKNDFNTAYTYWVKLSIANTPDSDKKWLLEFYDQSIDKIEAYFPDEDGVYQRRFMGDNFPFSNRLFNHKNFQLEIPNDQDRIENFYFKINSSQKADIRIAVRSLDRFIHYALSEYFLFGLFYGMILIIAFYNFLIFLAVREMKYIYYILYILSVGLYAMSLDGIGFQYFWPQLPELNFIVNGVFSFFIIFWAVLFTIRFLNTRRRAKKFHYLLWFSLFFKSLIFLTGLLFDKSYFEISYYDLLPFLLIFSSGIYLLLKNFQAARFFVMAYGVLFTGVFIKVLASYAIIPHHTIIYYSLHFAFLIEMVLLSFALGDRIRIMKEIRDKALRRSLSQYKENIALKERVNLELETKVRCRTTELEEKNRLLEQYNQQLQEKDEEIKRINNLLDKDNWKLKSSIRDSYKARISQQSLSREEFANIFPDQSACYRYLEDLKWGRGFSCRQCGKSKFGKGPKWFSRRCSHCGHIDSVTAGTIFHGIKFPLEKAFYILYASFMVKEKITLDELSASLNLSRNTIWAFRKKVNQKVLAAGDGQPSWEEMILLYPLPS